MTTNSVSWKSATWATVSILLVFLTTLALLQPDYFWQDDSKSQFAPGFASIARSFEKGEWPLTGPGTWFSSNFAGEYQYGTFSLFQNLLIGALWVPDLPDTLRTFLFTTIHLLIFAIGALLLCRIKGIRPEYASAVAVTISLNGWLIIWSARSWVSTLTSVIWLTWFWWALEKLARSPSRTPLFLSALFIYLTFSAGWPFSNVMLVFIFMMVVIEQWLDKNRNFAVHASLAGLIGTLWSAPSLYYLIEQAAVALRMDETVGQEAWTIPLSAFPGFVFPAWTSTWPGFSGDMTFQAWDLANGVWPTLILLLALARGRATYLRQRLIPLLLLLEVIALCISDSLGPLRWSFRWLPLLQLLVAVLAAEYLSNLTDQERSRYGPLWVVRWTLGISIVGMIAQGWSHPEVVAFGISTIGILSVLWILFRLWPQLFMRSGFLLIGTLLLFLVAGFPIQKRYADWNLGHRFQPSVPLEKARTYFVFATHEEFADPNLGQFLFPGNMALYDDFQVIHGYSSMQLKSWAVHFNYSHLGALFPKRAVKVLEDETDLDGSFEWIGIDGIILSPRFLEWGPTLEKRGWIKVFANDRASLFHRQKGVFDAVRAIPKVDVATAIPPSWHPSIRLKKFENIFWSPDVKDASTEFAKAEISKIERGTRSIRAHVTNLSPKPALVAFSQPWTPGLKATWQDQPVAVGHLSGLVPAVLLAPGQSGWIELKNHPHAVIWSLIAALFGFLVLWVSANRIFAPRKR